MTIPITNIIGTKLMHGSPGNMNEEIISKVVFVKECVEIEFESQCFTQMTPDEYEYLLRYEELSYNEATHGGLSNIVFCDRSWGH